MLCAQVHAIASGKFAGLTGHERPPSYRKKFFAILRIRFILWRRRPLRYLSFLAISIALVGLAACFEEVIVIAEVNEKHAEAKHAASLSQVPLNLFQYESLLFKSNDFPLIIRALNNNDYIAVANSLAAMELHYDRLPSNNAYKDLDWYGTSRSEPATYYAGADIHNWPRTSEIDLSSPPGYDVWYNGTFTHSLPIAINVLSSLYYNVMVDSQSNGKQPSVSKHISKKFLLFPQTTKPVLYSLANS